MKHHILILTVLVAITLSLDSCSNKENTCNLKGRVFNRNSDTLYLIKATEDIRFAQIMIPIVDSSFEYKLTISDPEAYTLIFKDEIDNGAWRPINFFAENGDVFFELHSFNDFVKNKVTGGPLNTDYKNYTKSFENEFNSRFKQLSDSFSILSKNKELYSPEMDSLRMAINNTTDSKTREILIKKINSLKESGLDLSAKGKTINEKIQNLVKESTRWRYNYIEKNPSIVSYYLLLGDAKDLGFKQLDINDIKRCYPALAEKFPNHPYTSLLKSIIEGLEVIKLGGKYIDFKLPDLNGKEYKLSEIIKDKFALIDLWASWCGPCIKTSRTMIPIYEQYKEKGFTICGVAAEIKNTDQLKVTLEREKFPWVNLIELDHKNHIWDIYGRANSGGGTFLVDKSGTILVIDPTAEKVKQILDENLK